MRTITTRLSGQRLVLAAFTLFALAGATAARATVLTYTAALSGPAEAPANASPGTGTGLFVIDDVAHTMHVHIEFSGLTGNTTASHVHGPTTVAGTGTAGVTTTLPTFAGFPLGVTSGTYDIVLDMTQASSYSGAFVTANGGTPAGAEAALYAAIAAGKAYLNIHSSTFGGGEIRGFLQAGNATRTARGSWGKAKSKYR